MNSDSQYEEIPDAMPSAERLMRAHLSGEFPNRFQRESLNLVNALLQLSSSAFYLVGPDMRHRGVVLRDMEPELERLYETKFRQLDPLNPAFFAHCEQSVVCIDEQLEEAELLVSDYYLEFMAPNSQRHVTDMFFRCEGDIVAVLTMLRSEAAGPFSVQELLLLRKLQPFLEYTLNTVYLPKRTLQRLSVGQRFSLTDREVDVLELMVAETITQFGQVDIAIHNAAIYRLHTLEELTDELMEQTLAVNMKAAVWLTQACVPHFRRNGWGRLIFTSSVTGPRVAMPGTSHYAMSKGGMNGFIRTAALEYARENITVNGVEPGYILTAAMSALGDEQELAAMAQCIPLGVLGKPEDIANTMLFLASDEASYLTGQTIVVDGGSTLPESQVVMDGFYD